MASRKPAAKDLAIEANYVVITVSYNETYVLPHEAGMQFLECLKHAEKYVDKYSEGPKIQPLVPGDFKLELLGRQRYVDIKTAQLLGVTLEELENSRKEEKDAA